MHIRSILYAALLPFAAACMGPGDSPSGPDLSADATRTCRVTQDLLTVRRRLSEAGIANTPAGDIRQPFMSVPATVLRVDRADVQLFVYRDARARAADTNDLDPARVSPPTVLVNWVMPPSFVASCNVAAIVLTRDEALRARIHAAVAAP